LAAEKLAVPWAAYELASVNYRTATGEHGFGDALDLNAFEHGVVDAHVMGFCADYFLLVGIKDD
jgi:hypothetical protein